MSGELAQKLAGVHCITLKELQLKGMCVSATGNVVLRMHILYAIFDKGGGSFNHIEAYHEFKAKFLPPNPHKTSYEIAQRKLGQSVNNILIKIFQKTNKKTEKLCKTFT
mgnify:CR=1 FL=1